MKNEIQVSLVNIINHKKGIDTRILDHSGKRELIQISRRLAEHAHNQGIRRVAFIDRSARLGYIGFRKEWHNLYPQEKLPSIIFFNPRSFVYQDFLNQKFKLSDELTLTRAMMIAGKEMSEIQLLLFSWRELVNEILPQKGRALTKNAPANVGGIVERLRQDFPRLCQDKKSPLLLIDTCRHTGNAYMPIAETLKCAGFKDVRLALVSHTRDLSGQSNPDFVALPGEPTYACYPFKQDSMVEKTTNHLYSAPTASSMERRCGQELRRSLKAIFAMEIR